MTALTTQVVIQIQVEPLIRLLRNADSFAKKWTIIVRILGCPSDLSKLMSLKLIALVARLSSKIPNLIILLEDTLYSQSIKKSSHQFADKNKKAITTFRH